VLITLGIIGVVAAVTIPTLMNNASEEQYTTALKRFYSDLSSAMVTMQASDSPYNILINDVDVNESNAMRDNLCGIMSCIKTGTAVQIFGSSIVSYGAGNTVYKNYKSTYSVFTDLWDNMGAATLSNGMFVGVHWFWEARNSFQLYVDTNGAKGPNMFGKDLNMFEIVKDASGYYKPVVEGGPGTFSKVSSGNTCLTGQSTYNNVWPCSYYRMYTPDKMP